MYVFNFYVFAVAAYILQYTQYYNHHNASKGYWNQRADERHGNPPPRLSGAISGHRQSWKTPR